MPMPLDPQLLLVTTPCHILKWKSRDETKKVLIFTFNISMYTIVQEIIPSLISCEQFNIHKSNIINAYI